MAKLLPPVKSSIIKSKSSSLIKDDKPILKINSYAKKTRIINPKKLLAPSQLPIQPAGKLATQTKKTDSSEDILIQIEKKVIKIDKLLKDSLILQKKDAETKRKKKEKGEFDEKEKELESKKLPKVKGLKLPTPPKLGILDWIKNFIFNTLLGFIAIRLIDHLPKLLELLPIIVKVADFITDVGGKLLDGLVTFIDWGYKAYDSTRGFIKNLFGESGVKKFDELSSVLNTFLNLAIIAGMSVAGSGKDSARHKRERSVKPNQRQSREYGSSQSGRPKVTTTGGGRSGRPDIRNPFRRRPNVTTSGGGRAGGFDFSSLFRRRPNVTTSGGATKGILSSVRPFLKRIPLPVVGALIDFGLSVALGENPGRAAFRAIGAGLFGAVGAAVGSVVPFAGNIIGGVVGGMAGDAAGGALYDLFFSNKKPNPGKVNKLAGGGRPITRGGKPANAQIKRTIKKKRSPRTLKVVPSKLKPGSVVGGEKKIKDFYPNPDDKTKMNPFDFMKKSYETYSKSTGLFAIAPLVIKSLMGDNPGYVDYKSASMGINNWMNQIITSGTLAYAGGGEVNMESIVFGEDYSDVIARSLQDSVAPQTDKIIQDLMKQLMLKKSESERTPDEQKEEPPTMEGGDDDGFSTNAGDYKDLLNIIASRESSTAGGYNAYNEGGAGGGYTIVGYGGDSRNGPLRRSLVDMTVKEIMDHQRNVNPPIHAAGRYQIIGSTLKALINGNYGLTGVKVTDKFDANTQDKLGIALIKYRLKTGATPENFINEWRGLKFVNRDQLQAAINKAQKGRIYFTGGDVNANVGPGSREWRFGRTGRMSVAPNWSHAHFDSTDNNTLTRDMIPLLKRMASSGIKPELKNGTPILPGKDNNYYAELVRSGISQHTHRPGPRMDVNMPGFPMVPFPLRYSFYQAGGAGHAATVPGSGKTMLFHMSKKPDGTAFHGRTGFVSKDGFTLKLHKGEMYKVIDKDSVDLFGRDFIQDIIDIENKPQLIAKAPSIIKRLQRISGYDVNENKNIIFKMPIINQKVNQISEYTDYEQPQSETEYVYVEVPIKVPVPIPMGNQGPSFMMVGGGGIDNSDYEMLEMI